MVIESFASLDRPVPVQPICTEWSEQAGVTLDMLRLDELDPEIGGNKWYKLKHNLIHAREQGKTTVLSFGGAWSNHIHALAAAGHRFGIATVGVIRGEPSAEPTATLIDARRWGMQLQYLTRADYRRKNDPDLIDWLLGRAGLVPEQVHIVPEGGSNRLGVSGCQGILAAGRVLPGSYDEIWLACGTGATLAGIALTASETMPDTRVKGVAVLKGADFLRADIDRHTQRALSNWTLLTDYHHGGYARTTDALRSLILSFEQETGIPLDPVYTGKVLFALKDSLRTNATCYRSKRLLVVHTGGLQGRRGMAFQK